MRILYITSTRIGDAVLGSGALADLVERFPEARFKDVPRLERARGREKAAASS